jgi:hypothetical protein
MSGFAKLVPEIIESSIWNEDSDTRVVWITMIAKRDENGYVRGDARTIARMANVSLDAAEKALHLFQQPDPSSHTPDNEGRRIEPMSGGWLVLNHELYRSEEHVRREKNRERVRKHRNTKAPTSGNVTVTLHSITEALPSASVSASVSDSGGGSKGGQSGYASDPTLEEFRAFAEGLCIPAAVVESCYHHYASVGFMRGQTRITNFRSLLAKWWATERSSPRSQHAPRKVQIAK